MNTLSVSAPLNGQKSSPMAMYGCDEFPADEPSSLGEAMVSGPSNAHAQAAERPPKRLEPFLTWIDVKLSMKPSANKAAQPLLAALPKDGKGSKHLNKVMLGRSERSLSQVIKVRHLADSDPSSSIWELFGFAKIKKQDKSLNPTKSRGTKPSEHIVDEVNDMFTKNAECAAERMKACLGSNTSDMPEDVARQLVDWLEYPLTHKEFKVRDHNPPRAHRLPGLRTHRYPPPPLPPRSPTAHPTTPRRPHRTAS